MNVINAIQTQGESASESIKNSPVEDSNKTSNNNTRELSNTNSDTDVNNKTSKNKDIKTESDLNSTKETLAPETPTTVNSRCNLIVNYLPQSVKEPEFNQLFAKIGSIKTCKLMFDRQTGYSFGYGFVEYTNEEDAMKAIETFNGFKLEHKRLKVALARPNCDETKDTNLYIRNIPASYDEQQLLNLFTPFGQVVQVRILRDQSTSLSRGIGFAIMSTKQMAQLAIAGLDGTRVPLTNDGSSSSSNGITESASGSSTEPIYVKYADEESKKRHGGGNSNGGQHNNNNYNNNHKNNNGNNNWNVMQQQNQFNNMNKNNNNNQFKNNDNNTSNNNVAMMRQQLQLQQNAQQMLQNLDKTTNQRGDNANTNQQQQSRYNALVQQIGGGGPGGLEALNLSGSTSLWNSGSGVLQQQQQQQQHGGQQSPYTSFSSSGFDTLIGATVNGGNAANGTSQWHHQQQIQKQNNQKKNFANQNGLMNIEDLSTQQQKQHEKVAANLSSPRGATADVDAPAKTNEETNSSSIIYVYGIGSLASESDLYSLFSQCGRILRVNVIKNPKTGQCKGYGFVVFDTYEEALCAVQNMNGYIYHNRPLQVSLKLFKVNGNNNHNNGANYNNEVQNDAPDSSTANNHKTKNNDVNESNNKSDQNFEIDHFA